MAMTDQTVRGRTRRSVATVVQAKIVIIFLGTRARKLGTAIIQAGERASLGGAGVDRAKVTRKPRATGRGSIVVGLAGINVAGGIRGVGSTCVVRRYRRSPARLRRGGCTARKDIPSCTAGLFCLLRLLVQSGKHRRLAQGHALTGAALSSVARRAGLTSPVRTRRNCRTAAIAALKVITSHKEILAIESQ